MRGMGTNALLLLMGIGISAHLATGGEASIGLIELYSNLDVGIDTIVQQIFNSFTSAITLAGVTSVSILAWRTGRSLGLSLGIALLTGMGSVLLTPFTFASSLGFSSTMVTLVQSVFNLILFLAVVGFLLEKEF